MNSMRRLTEDEFIVLVARHERRVRGFVFTFVNKRQDADEIVQQAFLTAWRKRNDFVRVEETIEKDFARWLCTIARFEALGYVRKNRGAKLLFDSDLVEKLANIQLQDDRIEERQAVVEQCIKKLAESQRDLVRRYYRANESAEAIAKTDGVSKQAIFQRLRAVRTKLMECVRRNLAACEPL